MTERLPVVSGKEAMKVFEKAGWEFVRVGSSRHYIYKKKGFITTLSVPDHKVLDRGLLRALIRDAYMSIDEFLSLLRD
jgi:predicted RNA binding protein YcfA (HicA-like mRNA interferase family)